MGARAQPSDENQPTFEGRKLLTRDDYHHAFTTDGYLRDFYERMDEPAMKVVLSYLPGFAYRVPQGGRLLDIGSGPTIHVAVAFRNRVDEIYLTDYLPNNRAELNKWLKGESQMDWHKPLSYLAVQENLDHTSTSDMEKQTRPKISGIMYSDVFNETVVPDMPKHLLAEGFEVVTSIFTIEYCCTTVDEYRIAIRNTTALVKPGGHILLGGMLEEDYFKFDGREFHFLFVTEQLLMECLAANGIDTDRAVFLFDDHLFLLFGKKKL